MKNKFTRLASVMLVLTLLTTCGVSGTYAKYVTTSSASDTARVAKFGVNITAGGSAFAKTYATDTQNVALAAGGTLTDSVASNDKVVAPGTKGSFTDFTITGTPEVAVAVSYTVTTFNLGNNWVDEKNSFYCPIIIKVGNSELDGKNFTSATEFENAVKNAIQSVTGNYAAGTDLANADNHGLNISWEWPFEVEGNDVKDTYLGNRAAGAVDNAGTIALGVTCTVTQID